MRIRLWTSIAAVALALTGVLFTFCRVPAGEIMPTVIDDECPAATRCAEKECPGPACPNACTGCPACAAKTVAVKTPGVPMLLTNNRKIRLNYSISDVGPSGVSNVELWATRDTNAWQRYSRETPPAGPLCVQVAEEGRYGFSIVVRNGLGMASPAPKTQDAPQIWVEVDETAPKVRLTDLQLGRGDQVGTLSIGWTSSDAHIKDRPVTLSYAAKKDGPYTKIVSRLDDAGVYVWRMPKNLPYRFFVKAESEDRAGNVGVVVSPEAVCVDFVAPKGVIIGLDSDKTVNRTTDSVAVPVPTPMVITTPVPVPVITTPRPVIGELKFGVNLDDRR